MAEQINRYQASNRGDTWVLTVEAATISEAASQVARQLHGRRMFARRTTGTLGLSGWFQSYRRIGTASESVGVPFHVTIV